MPVRTRVYSRVAKEAARLLGQRIKIARKQKGWSETALAERAGVARATVQKAERGDLGTAIGLAFELAVLVDVPLFDPDPSRLRQHLEQGATVLALLPKHTHAKNRVVNDDF